MLEVAASIAESSDSSYFKITDRTGIYNPLPQPCSDNGPTGWGTPNPNYTQATSAILQIKLPDPVGLLPQPNFYIIPSTGLNYIDVSSVLPNVIKTPYQVNASDIGLPCFQMGVYEFLLSYGGSWGVTIYKWKMRQAFIQQGCCCVKNMQSELECSNQQNQIKIDDWMNGVVALATVKADMNCLKQQRTAQAIQRLNDICKRNPCGCNENR